MRQGSINFFSTRNSTPPYLAAVEPYIMPVLVGVGGLVTLAGAGVIAAYIILSATKATLERQKQESVDYLKAAQKKEQTYAFIRSRITAVQTVQKLQKSFAPFIDTALAIAQPPKLMSFGLTDAGQVRIQVAVDSIEEGETVIQSILNLANNNVIRNQTLAGIDYPNNGRFVLTVLYNVVGRMP